ncbi:hypothetical protein OIU34_22025 [Pararhizobium sp. BT-229]|uniref:hypothetical protein n=1 Tax=Pararhizobium sp. BT-229 TaxID=2986923 RepID=UPI0021F7842D|nr:hypothetical protein [Pararhizobium sp. BT-229]MCV9964571.1 hypothetical protein [Pararhizobium sp. BT-229]
MIVGNAERRKYEAHVELAARHGVSTVLPITVETTFFVPHAIPGAAAAVVEVPVRVDAEVSIHAEGDVVTRLGDVGWRDYRHSDPFRTATYFISNGEVPHLLRSVGVGYGEEVPGMATDPFSLVEWLVVQCSREIRDISEPTPEQTRDAIRQLVENRIREGVKASPLVVGRDGHVTMARAADVPHFKVVTRDSRPPVDAAYSDVVIDRPEDFESMNWKDLGLRFEPWEAEVAGRVVRSCGVNHGRTVPDGIDFRRYAAGDVAVDLAVVNRFAMKSLLPLFVKKVMLDLSSSEVGQDDDVRAHTSAAYGAVAKGEWGSSALEEALSALHDLWKYDARFNAFSRSMGWNLKLSPFEIMTARVAAFPWRGPAPEAASRPSSPAP